MPAPASPRGQRLPLQSLRTEEEDDGEHHHSDQSPLLKQADDLGKVEDALEQGIVKPTPLPILQVAIVIFLRTCVPINFQVIFPFINKHVMEMPGSPAQGDPAKVGYYVSPLLRLITQVTYKSLKMRSEKVGIIEGLFLLCMCIIALPFGRWADRLGRKPMLLIGLGGATVCTAAFGWAPSLTAMIVARSLSGITNGSVGVLRTIMAEITDSTNRNTAFSLFPLAFASGTAIGAFIGGQAYQDFQETSTPALRPCLIAAGFTFVGLLITVLFFKESLPAAKRVSSKAQGTANKTESLRSLLTRRLQLLLFNYGFLSFMNAGQIAIFPLYAFTPLNLFGLGWSQKTIGTVMALQAIPTVIIQLLYFPRFQKAWGSARLYRRALPTFFFAMLILPMLPLAKLYLSPILGDAVLWTGIVAYTLLYAFGDWSFTTLVLMINSEASSGSSLGAINGVAITVNTAFRAVAPPVASSLFAWSVGHPGVLFGQTVWLVLASIAGLGCLASLWLPEESIQS